MKFIAIATESNAGLEAPVSSHFGRCPFYTIAKIEDGKIIDVEIHENPHAGSHQRGAMPSFVKSLDADVVITGGMGPQAVQIFKQLGIEVCLGISGNVNEVVNKYLSGDSGSENTCTHE